MTADRQDVTVLMAVRGAEDAARLALSSLERHTSPIPVVLLADNGTGPAFAEWLRPRPHVLTVTLKDRVGGRAPATREAAAQHAESLDRLAERATTPWLLTMDSDIEILVDSWLDRLLDLAQARGVDAVGELEPGPAPAMPRLAPHLLLLRRTLLTDLGASFRGRAEIDDPGQAERFRRHRRPAAYRLTASEAAGFGSARFYSTGAALFEAMQTHGRPWAPTPPELRADYRHLGHMSWASKHPDLAVSQARNLDYVRFRNGMPPVEPGVEHA
ncbi:MAG: glycosyltransferase family 2 protein [Jatrophihabitantaceae bacterium]